ncbi:protein DEFECTIVE IN MERISTEM SILENCING 3-like isoform X3 [Alnus glutinosa]|uniref:protein DEFECTIVE IN MERISTEM SILENCING 3-like isoform X3 n=1 Tax=Alnus glutinosa TaxID=3517 RepID=UPI002D77999B|nr:protein DEFECTIVE IN MERISTEM SILENCING 3-like isoform X3 [Alnus glutinosa]
MFEPSNHQLAIQKPISFKDSSTLMQVDQNETSIVVRDEMQNGGSAHAETIIYHSKKLQGDLHMLGVKIKEHEENIKFLKTQNNKLDDSILDFQVKYHTSSTPKIEHENNSQLQPEEQTTEQILHHEKSAAGILFQLKTPHGTQASHLPLTKDVLGIVATLGKVDDDNLSRLFAEYLGVETMLAIVCKTYEGVKALETYDNEGCINKSSGLHRLGASIGRALDGRFLVICLENLMHESHMFLFFMTIWTCSLLNFLKSFSPFHRPYVGGFVAGDPQRRLDLIKPRLPNGECPSGFLGFAVNMINMDNTNLFCLTASGHGLRETLFYNLFSRLQVYRTRAEMLLALPCISDGALSLDGGMIKSTGVFSLGNREDVDVKFPKPSVTSTLRDNCIEAERRVKEMKWKKEKMLEDMNREQALLQAAKFDFDKKKQEFLKFIAESSSYATQPPLCSSFSLTKEHSTSKTSAQSSRLLTDSQIEGDAYFTNRLHEGSHFDNELMGSPNLMGQMSPSQVEIESSSKRQRGSNFTIEEDNLLVLAWLNTNMDSMQGNEQKHKIYWRTIWEYFHKNKTFISKRTQLSLLNRWSLIKKSTKLFCGYMAQIEAMHQSGVNEEDKIAKAKLMFHEFQKTSFQFQHCWNVLRSQPKWINGKIRKEHLAGRLKMND